MSMYLETPRGKLERIGGWNLGKTLGRGAYAHVRLATHSISGRKAACKILPSLYGTPNVRTGRASSDEITDAMEAHKELVLLKAINGAKIPGVVGLEGIIEEEGWNYIFLTLHEKSLSHYHKGIPEQQFCSFFAELLRTMEALHSIGISHEDLKRSNILVQEEKDSKGHVRLHPIVVDLGFSHLTPYVDDNGAFKVRSLGGTFDYSSPLKIAEELYDPFANDMWSLGIVFLKMFRFPHPYLDNDDYFDNKNEAKMRIVLGGPVWSWRRAHCSPYGIAHFVMSMMERHEPDRATATDLLAHPYLKRRVQTIPPKVPIPSDRISSKVSRPVSPAILQDIMFLAHQAGDLFLCETSKNLELRLYGREPCWEQQFVNMLAKWEQKTDLEWEDLQPVHVTKRSTKRLPRRTYIIRPLKEIHLSPLKTKPTGNQKAVSTERTDELPHKLPGSAMAAPFTPPGKILTSRPVNVPAAIAVKRPKVRIHKHHATPIKPKATTSSTTMDGSSVTMASNKVPVAHAPTSRLPRLAKGATTNTRTTRNAAATTSTIR